MDPLFKVREAYRNDLLAQKAHDLIETRFELVISGIARIEKASGINYPVAYVEPAVITTPPDANSFQYGILFARTIPLELNSKFRVVIQLSAPLVAYGLKGTVHAVLAHEFLHYLELISRAGRMEMVSDDVSGSLFENIYADESRLFEPGAVFRDRTLLRHITKKFPAGFRDFKLEDKVIKYWIDAGLPRSEVPLDRNTAKISAKSLAGIELSADLARKLDELRQKSESMRKRTR